MKQLKLCDKIIQKMICDGVVEVNEIQQIVECISSWEVDSNFLQLDIVIVECVMEYFDVVYI